MAGVKDKVVTVEALSALHDYNNEIYASKEELSASQDYNEETYVSKESVISMRKGGTGAYTGANGLANLLADGVTVLSVYQYGDSLPMAGVRGRIFFKRVIE